MRGKGNSMGHSQPQPGPSTGRKTLRSCRNKKEADDVVVIDVDCDNFRNVIFIDIPESSSKKIKGSDSRVPRKDKRCPLKTVIYIDDDDDDESTEDNCNGKGVNGKGNFAGPSSSMGCTTSYQNSVDEVGDECQFVQENISPVKLSKCKRTYSGKVSSRNQYGLTSDIEGDSSDSDDDDGVDCEFIMENSSEPWEKAFLKRKKDACKENQARTSNIFNDDIHQKTEKRSKTSTSSLGKDYQFGHSEADDIFENGDCSFQKEEQYSPQKPPLSPIIEQSAEHVDRADIFFQDKQKTRQEGSVLSSTEPNEEASFRNMQPSSEPVEDHGVAPTKKIGEILKEFIFGKSSLGKSEVEVEKDLHQEQEEAAPEEPSFCKVSVDEEKFKQGSPCLVEENEVSAKSFANGEDAADNHLHAQDGDNTTDCIDNSLINEREKMKETDEYKRAVEEEWAARQRELQIQAEAAQHLRRMRKRRKAETMRLLDMEKRQKQRVEEIRETQKKDEENMNLKEKLRAEVRKELYKLEVTCTDMASLLRGLGIVVNGGLHPQSQEVRIAYKKALLNFHPDRSSQSNIRQQVEAEEKFKLISRMKDKFLPTL